MKSQIWHRPLVAHEDTSRKLSSSTSETAMSLKLNGAESAAAESQENAFAKQLGEEHAPPEPVQRLTEESVNQDCKRNRGSGGMRSIGRLI